MSSDITEEMAFKVIVFIRPEAESLLKLPEPAKDSL